MVMSTLGLSAPFSDSCTITSIVLPLSNSLRGGGDTQYLLAFLFDDLVVVVGLAGCKAERDLLGGLVLGHRVQAQDGPLRVFNGAKKRLRLLSDDDQNVPPFS
jgi:hypothetical protein